MLEVRTNEEVLWPPKIDLVQVWLSSVWSIISWFVWSIVVLISIYVFLKNASEITWAYWFIYAVTCFFATLFSSWLNIFINKTINPDKYQRWSLAFTQVFMFYIFMFIFFLPSYIYATWVNWSYIIFVFSANLIIAMLASNIITEVLSSYRYVLLWIYWSFIWGLVAMFLTFFVFLFFLDSAKNIFVLIWLLILVNFAITTIRVIFEFLYYQYYSKTWADQLWDIYYQIELEEKEMVEAAKRELTKFK